MTQSTKQGKAKRDKYPLLSVDGHIKSIQGMCADEMPHATIWNELDRLLSGLRKTTAYRAELRAYTPEFLNRVAREKGLQR